MTIKKIRIDHTLPPELVGAGLALPIASSAAGLTSGGFIGTSAVMQALYRRIEQAAASRAPVLITGEAGTGKTTCAKILHRLGPSAETPFIVLNCAAMSAGQLDSALFAAGRGALWSKGEVTLFLDDTAAMPEKLQEKFRHQLRTGRFLPRLICASDSAAPEALKYGVFQQTLFYDLQVAPLVMPPLRLRGDDVTDIAQTLLRRFSTLDRKKFTGFTAAAETRLQGYDWPGNLRELQDVMRQIVTRHNGEMVTEAMVAGALDAPSLPVPVRPALGDTELFGTGDAIRPLAAVERLAVERAIRLCGGNIPRAAARLGVSPSTLYRKKTGWDEDPPEKLFP